MNQRVELLDWFHLENRLACMKRIKEENSDFERKIGTDMIDVLEDDEIVIDDDLIQFLYTLFSPK